MGERERMQSSLAAGTRQFSQDFNREITRAYLSFQMDASILKDDQSGKVSERFDEWKAKAPYPNLVSDLYLLDKGEGDLARLRHFNRAHDKFDLTEWPKELEPLRLRLSTEEPVSHVREPAFLGGLLIEPVEPNVPAIVFPIIVSPQVLLSGNENIQIKRSPIPPESVDRPPFAGYLILKLDREVITNELIPNLAKRYFSGGNGLEYNLTVLNLQNLSVPVYQSHSASKSPQIAGGDATARLMDIQPEQLDALWFGLPRRSDLPDDKGSRLEHKIPQDNVVVRTDTQSEKGPSNSRSVTVRVLNRNAKEIKSIDKTVESGPWQLLIQHRAGSLEAAVTSARRRNLAVSFGVLLLLAGSVAMIVVSTRRAERLANRQMEFVSAVSHEFRTPLSVICSAGENLADGVIESSYQTKKYGELVRNEGRRLAEMVEQVLEFAGARSKNRSYQMRPVDIGSVIEDALTSYQPVIDQKGYIVEQKIEDCLPLISADGASIRRSLQNLLSNAIKYESENRWIGIRAQSESNVHGEEVQVIIEDRGIGIAVGDVPHIFEPFYRGHDVVEAQIHGNGLGLSLVKKVIDAHHGTISVVSEEGKGSTFTLRFPVINSKLEGNVSDSAAKL